MPGEKKWRIPQFTVANLLVLTAAVAVGFAVSQSPPPDESTGWSAVYSADMRIPEGFVCTGGVLLIYELVRQTKLLSPRRRRIRPELRFSLQFAVSLRVFFAVGISGLLVLRLLLNRRILIQPDHEDFLNVYGDLWPDLLLEIALIAAIRLILVKRQTPARSPGSKWLINVIMSVGLVGSGIYILTDRTLVPALVHFATDGVEKSHSIEFQRLGVFPHHLAEGFRSYWYATIAAGLVLSAACFLLVESQASRLWLKLSSRVAFASCVICSGVYAWWFALCDFPRISPDLANAGTASLWMDTLAGLFLLVGVAVALGYQLARTRVKDVVMDERLPVNSGLVAVGACAIAVAAGWDWLWFLRESISFTFWSFGQSEWVNTLGNFGQLFLYPEAMLPFALIISAFSLFWHAIRQPDSAQLLQPVAGRHFVGYTLASIALLIVAIPTFAAFGFCYWLGPLVL